MGMSPERVMEHAETVRELYQAERKLGKLAVKVEHGHRNLLPFRDRLVERITTTVRGAA